MMRAFVTFLLFAACLTAETSSEIARQLDEIGRIATAMVDGDAAKRIVTKRALESFHKVDPKDPWIASDNFDVNHEPYIQVKKTLIRLSKLAAFPCDVNLWLPVKGMPGRIQIVIRNVHEMSQFWSWGVLHQDTPPQMKAVLTTGKRVTVTGRPNMISVLAPVYDSLGDVVAVAEAVAQEKPNPRENVK
jgi:hypothetical protein